MQQRSLLEDNDSPLVQYWPGFLDGVEADQL